MTITGKGLPVDVMMACESARDAHFCLLNYRENWDVCGVNCTRRPSTIYRQMRERMYACTQVCVKEASVCAGGHLFSRCRDKDTKHKSDGNHRHSGGRLFNHPKMQKCAQFKYLYMHFH